LKQEHTITENRRYPRYKITENPNYSIHFRSSQDMDYSKASTINISKGGIMLSSDVPHRPHTRIEIVIYSPNNNDQAIFLQGVVCWTGKAPAPYSENKGYYAGIQFSGISELKKTSLDEFMKAYVLDQ
jgi:c-di-GMP-binding flagellar brake protein YcgR